ncbi:hypothetical protein Xkoz_00765 [Xenorhabdus kozodoii]|uniref:Uncharacterized protein n=1 Tax=Xenorhabdus kozodoii TaxID=351676 RepID=A0A2D0LFX8_9GAMM|nr:hypothetical protein Xkoz_00765 [Xenorhabdus kozodoii]
MDFLLLILEIFYKSIKCIIRFFVWIFKIAVKDVVISFLSVIILFCIIFSFIIPKFVFGALLLLIFIYWVYKYRRKIRDYLS